MMSGSRAEGVVFLAPKKRSRNAWLPLCDGVFLASTQTASQSAVPGASTPRVRRRSEAVDVDHGQLVYPSLKDCPVVMDLHELSPVDRRQQHAAPNQSPPQPHPPRPRLRLLIDLGVGNSLKAPLALVDDLVQDSLAFSPIDVASAVSVAGTIAGAITTCLSAGGPVCRTERHLPRRPLDR